MAIIYEKYGCYPLLESDDEDCDTQTTMAERKKEKDGAKKQTNTVCDITFDTDPLTADSYEPKGNNNTRPPPELIIPLQCLMTKARTNNFPYTWIN